MRSYCPARRAALLSLAAAAFAFWTTALPPAARLPQQGRGVRAVRTDSDPLHGWVDDRCFEAVESAEHADGTDLGIALLPSLPPAVAPSAEPLPSGETRRPSAAVSPAGHPWTRPPPVLF